MSEHDTYRARGGAPEESLRDFFYVLFRHKTKAVLFFVVVVGLYAAAVYLAGPRRREALRSVGVALAISGWLLGPGSETENLAVAQSLVNVRELVVQYLRSDRPHEVGIATFANGDSKPMQSCVLTATVGNYARLRRLHLADSVMLSTDLWPRFEGNEFAPAKRFPLGQLTRSANGHAVVSAQKGPHHRHRRGRLRPGCHDLGKTRRHLGQPDCRLRHRCHFDDLRRGLHGTGADWQPVDEVPANLEDKVRKAAEQCDVDAIIVEE